jgi:hypothetical protein
MRIVNDNPARNESEKSSYRKEVEVEDGARPREKKKSCGSRL